MGPSFCSMDYMKAIFFKWCALIKGEKLEVGASGGWEREKAVVSVL